MAKRTPRPPSLLRAEWFWIDRWAMSECSKLPIHARGFHREMLTQAWALGGKLPDDKERLKLILNVTEEEWESCWPMVSRYWLKEGKNLINDDQAETYSVSESRAIAASARAQKAAKSRRAITNNQREPSEGTSRMLSGSGSVSGSGRGSGSGSGSETPPSLPKGGTPKIHPDAGALILAHRDLFEHHPKVNPKALGNLKLASKALSRGTISVWRGYFWNVAKLGDGWLWDNGNFGMLLRPRTVEQWNAGQYRPSVKAIDPRKYTPLEQSAIRRARKKFDSGDEVDAERVLREQGLSLDGLRAEGQRRAGLNGHEGNALEVI